jgi:hypothetical protein
MVAVAFRMLPLPNSENLLRLRERAGLQACVQARVPLGFSPGAAMDFFRTFFVTSFTNPTAAEAALFHIGAGCSVVS